MTWLMSAAELSFQIPFFAIFIQLFNNDYC